MILISPTEADRIAAHLRILSQTHLHCIDTYAKQLQNKKSKNKNKLQKAIHQSELCVAEISSLLFALADNSMVK